MTTILDEDKVYAKHQGVVSQTFCELNKIFSRNILLQK